MLKALFGGAKSFALRINPTGGEQGADAGLDLVIDKKGTILETALEAGLAFPHDCKVGSCGTCKCKLKSGKIRERVDNALTLSREDLMAGYVLACQAHPKTDLVVEVDLLEGEEMHPVKVVAGSIKACNRQTHDIMEVVLELDEPIEYTAGQYADIEVDGIDAPRNFSFATGSNGALQLNVSFLIKHVPGGAFTGWLFAEDRTGHAIKLHAPYGFFHLYEGAGTIFCIAGGSGLAPLLSILEDAKHAGCTRDVVFLYGARTQTDLYKLDKIQAIADGWHGEFRFDPILSEEPESSDWTGPRGLVTEFIAQQNIDLATAQAYMCGPPPMIDAAEDVLTKAGMAANNIFADRFFDRSNVLSD